MDVGEVGKEPGGDDAIGDPGGGELKFAVAVNIPARKWSRLFGIKPTGKSSFPPVKNVSIFEVRLLWKSRTKS